MDDKDYANPKEFHQTIPTSLPTMEAFNVMHIDAYLKQALGIISMYMYLTPRPREPHSSRQTI